jgi:hypothetical protein
VYQTRNGADSLVVALNIDDEPLSVSLPEVGVAQGEILGGSGAPPQHIVTAAEVEPHGWLIIAPTARP